MEKERIKEMDSILKSSADDGGEESKKSGEGEKENKEIPDDKKIGKENDKESGKSKKEESSNESSESEEEDDQEDGELKQKDRWYGKSREEVIRMYEEFEKKQKPEAAPAKSEPAPVKEDKAGKENEDDELKIPGDEEFAKMTPKQFARWVMDNVKNLVGKTYDARSQMRDSVAQEIRDAQKDHPLLKASSEYRELVLALIESASQKGAVLSLKEACEKVDAFAGKGQGDEKVSDDDKIRLKKAKAQVERGAGAPASPGEDKDSEDRRLESIFGTGGAKSPLGGLGI